MAPSGTREAFPPHDKGFVLVEEEKGDVSLKKHIVESLMAQVGARFPSAEFLALLGKFDVGRNPADMKDLRKDGETKMTRRHDRFGAWAGVSPMDLMQDWGGCENQTREMYHGERMTDKVWTSLLRDAKGAMLSLFKLLPIEAFPPFSTRAEVRGYSHMKSKKNLRRAAGKHHGSWPVPRRVRRQRVLKGSGKCSG